MAVFVLPLVPPTAAAVTTPDDPRFEATVEPIGAELAEEMTGVSWHPGCPVPLSGLRLITMPHWGFDGQTHRGELVVHHAVATDVVAVFAGLYAERFPIRRMERIEAYGGDDEASMAADNTSAFNCREIVGGSGVSNHSFGIAIDINPLENPYIRDGVVYPPAGEEFLDRGDVRPGMFVDGDAVVTAFREIGFDWGGNWRTVKDYHHFEAADRPAAEEPDPGAPPPPSRARACSAAPPSSDAWSGGDLVNPDTGELDPEPFNRFLRGTDPPVSTSACDAARVLLHLDHRGHEGETVVVEVEPDAMTVTVTIAKMLDDSTEAVRYVLRFEGRDDGTISLASGAWSQRCQPGRGHQEFSTELCI